MKRNLKILCSMALMALVSACANHNEDGGGVTLPEVDAPKHLYASIERIASRTMVEDEKLLLWSDGDEISYFARRSSNLNYALQKTSGSQNDYGTFRRVTTHGEEGEKLDYNYGVYPYDEKITVERNGDISVELPSVQHYAKDSFGVGAATMVAVSDGRDGGMLQFKSAVGYLKLPLYGENIVVKSIELRGNDGEKLSGAATITAPYTTAPSVAMDTDASSVVTLDCGEGVALGNDATTPTAFWFALPPVLFARGFTIVVTDDKGVTYTKSTSKVVAIDRNLVLSMLSHDLRNDKNLDVEMDDKIMFYLAEREDGVRSLSGLGDRDWEHSKVLLNGVEYPVYTDGDSLPYIYADISPKGIYDAVLLSEGSSKWYGATPYDGVFLPYSQFDMRSQSTIKEFPMYASYTKADGRTLRFNDGFALLRVRVKGMADIVSVRVEAQDRYDLAGKVATVTSDGVYKVARGVNHVVLNCTNGGDFAPLYGAVNRDFYLMIAPGDYTEGLRLSLCDADHTAHFCDITDMKVEAGDLYTFDTIFLPSDGQIFYEGYDNCVWGGDVVRGKEGYGFAPDASSVTHDSNLDRTGYEESLTEVAYNVLGTSFVQSNTWNEVSGYGVAASHLLTDSYITSRHFADTHYLFRSVEHPGYIAVGTETVNRGIYASPTISNMRGIGSFKAKVRFAMQAGFNGTLEVQIVNGGRIVEASLDGTPLTLSADNLSYRSVSSILKLTPSQLSIAKSEEDEKVWHTLEMSVVDAADGSHIYITDTNVSNGVHGFYIDSFEVSQLDEWEKDESTLRVLLWNIQNGMWADQHNNYDNFVEWVKKWDADVCIWCESETIYKDKTGSSTSTKYLPDGWGELCKRYGHSYAAVGGNRDNYPQTVTSKYPITTVQRITDSNVSGKPIAHGAGHFTITINGKKVNIVTLHMWPQAYGFGVASANRDESAAKFEGDLYRVFEMQYIVDQTVNNSKYASEELWLLGGDTNARSRLDNWYYNYDAASTKLMTHDILLNQTNLKDVIGHRYPGLFISSTMGSARIDIMYASPAMYEKLTNSITLIDEWLSQTKKSEYHTSFYDRSDHRPLLMDFDMSK